MHFTAYKAGEVTERANALAAGGWKVIAVTRISMFGQPFTVFLERERA